MAYANYASITVDNTKVSGSSNLTNFPIKVSGTYDGTGGEPDIRTTANGGNVQNTASGGNSGSVTVPADLVFSPNTDGSTPYDFEIVSYNASTGAIEAWVEIPTLDYNDDTVFYMVYGDSGVTVSQEDVAGTWANFQNVYHFNEGSGATVHDSTGNSDGTLNQTDNWGTGEYNFDGTDDYVRTGITTAPNNFSIFAVAKTTVTGEEYLFGTQKTTPTQDYCMQRINNGNTEDRYGCWIYQSGSGLYGDNPGGPNYNDGNWHLMGTAVEISTPSKLYMIDGSSVTQPSYGAQNTPSTPYVWDEIYIATRNVNGSPNNLTDIDVAEFYVYEGTVDSDFTTTFYNTVLDTANFYTMGSEVGGGGGATAVPTRGLLGVGT